MGVSEKNESKRTVPFDSEEYLEEGIVHVDMEMTCP